MRKMIAAMGAALALSATSAAAQPFDNDGLGWGPYYNNHLSPYNGRPLGPPLSALAPGAEYYNGLPRAGYIVTPGPGYGPERSPGEPRRNGRAQDEIAALKGQIAGIAITPPRRALHERL
jgi:hypothetical protein